MPLDESDREMIAKLEAKAAPLLEEIEPTLAKVRRLYAAIATVYEVAGEAAPPPPLLFGGEPGAGIAAKPAAPKYGPAEFYEKPLATVVSQVLGDHGPQQIDDLYALMLEGGFNFTAQAGEKAKHNLKISLGKNSKFGRTPQGFYVLASEGGTRRRRATGGGTANAETDASDEQDGGDSAGSPETDGPEPLEDL